MDKEDPSERGGRTAEEGELIASMDEGGITQIETGFLLRGDEGREVRLGFE